MSTYSTLTLTATSTPLDLEAVTLDFDGTAVLSPSTFDEQPATTDPHGASTPQRIVLTWDDERWGVDGLNGLAERWSRDFACEAETYSEWDTHDADEPGADGARYRDGVLTHRGASTFVWSPA